MGQYFKNDTERNFHFKRLSNSENTGISIKRWRIKLWVSLCKAFRYLIFVCQLCYLTSLSLYIKYHRQCPSCITIGYMWIHILIYSIRSNSPRQNNEYMQMLILFLPNPNLYQNEPKNQKPAIQIHVYES